MEFVDFFKAATGCEPYPYQRRLADTGLPDVVEAPTGAGKTEAVVLPWLWRGLYGPPDVRAETPRRLVIALPMRTLVEQTEARVTTILAKAGLTDEVKVQVLMGGRLTRDDTNDWRTGPQKRSVVIGTIDAVVSRALNRGYGSTRGAYPIDFALVTNGAHLVVDEVQLGVQATATMRQVSAFQKGWKTAEPAGLTCMSATVLTEALDVVDNPYADGTASVVRLCGEDDEHPALAKRLQATKRVSEIDGCDKPRAIADAAREAHVPGTLTLVMVNTVDRAVETYQALKKAAPAELVLIHARFRGVERDGIVSSILSELPERGRIIVSTQSLEAGVDLDARTLVTEAAPWSSLAQRAGRCNRTGKQVDAQLLWFPALKGSPYPAEDADATAEALRLMEGYAVTGRRLLSTAVAQTPEDLSIIRRSDMLDLFETGADLAGRDIDISRYIRGDEQLDLRVAWVDTARYERDERKGIEPPPVLPPDALRCSVTIKGIRDFVAREPRPKVLVFSTTDDKWVRVTSGSQLRPQQLLLIEASDGGYDPELGFSPASRAAVPRVTVRVMVEPDSDGAGADAGATAGVWLPLRTHLDETREEAEKLLADIESTSEIDHVTRRTIIGAAVLHDIGKAHPIWQDALRKTAADPPEGDLAKSPTQQGRLRYDDGHRRTFRHELVSALMLMGPDGERAMADAGVPAEGYDLCRYLVAAHHGNIRLNPQDPTAEGRSGDFFFGLTDGDVFPLIGGGEGTVDLRATFGGGPGSWTDRSIALLEQWGPYRLAYAEMLVRMADWRASARTHVEVEL